MKMSGYFSVDLQAEIALAYMKSEESGGSWWDRPLQPLWCQAKGTMPRAFLSLLENSLM